MADYVIRATAADGQIRAFAATTRDLTETARQAHNTSPVATAALGRLMTAAVMMGYDMKGEDDLLTLKIQGDGPIGGLVVTADSKGEVKGYNASAKRQGKTGCRRCFRYRCFKRDQGYWLKGALCGTDHSGIRRDRRGFNILLCNL